jgi:hypothetical protein
MPTPPADRHRSTLLAIAFVALVSGGLALRSIRSAHEIMSRALPLTDLQSLSAFLSPLPDNSGLLHSGTGTLMVTRDPFVPFALPRTQEPTGGSEPVQPLKVDAEPWVVSSILVEGSRKSAIVNNTWVTIGDSLAGGSRLTAVERDHVVVTDANGIRHIVSIRGGAS